MKKHLLPLLIILSFGLTSLYAATQSSSVTRQSVTPKGQTTQLNQSTNTRTVTTTGEARCPTDSIMIGYTVTDSTAGYVNTRGTRAEEECGGLSADITNKTTKLMTDPTKLTYTIICRPVTLDYY